MIQLPVAVYQRYNSSVIAV